MRTKRVWEHKEREEKENERQGLSSLWCTRSIAIMRRGCKCDFYRNYFSPLTRRAARIYFLLSLFSSSSSSSSPFPSCSWNILSISGPFYAASWNPLNIWLVSSHRLVHRILAPFHWPLASSLCMRLKFHLHLVLVSSSSLLLLFARTLLPSLTKYLVYRLYTALPGALFYLLLLFFASFFSSRQTHWHPFITS